MLFGHPQVSWRHLRVGSSRAVYFLGLLSLESLCGLPSRKTLIFPQGMCSHRPSLEFLCGAQWNSMGKTWVLSSVGIS